MLQRRRSLLLLLLRRRCATAASARYTDGSLLLLCIPEAILPLIGSTTDAQCVVSAWIGGAYMSGGWVCNGCARRSLSAEKRWLCRGCTRDWCFTCHPRPSAGPGAADAEGVEFEGRFRRPRRFRMDTDHTRAHNVRRGPSLAQVRVCALCSPLLFFFSIMILFSSFPSPPLASCRFLTLTPVARSSQPIARVLRWNPDGSDLQRQLWVVSSERLLERAGGGATRTWLKLVPQPSAATYDVLMLLLLVLLLAPLLVTQFAPLLVLLLTVRARSPQVPLRRAARRRRLQGAARAR